jgi:arsenite-transporting ATPase
VHEAAQLQEDLLRTGIRPFAWVINQSLAPLPLTDPVLLARQRQEGKYICEVIQRLAASTAIVPWLAVPPVGAESLGPVVYGLWDGSSVRAATA